MASDRGAGGPRTGCGAHVWELPDCWMTSRDARGQSPLLQTASDDVTRAVRVLSAPRRPSTSVTERRARPRAASPATGGRGSRWGAARWCVPPGDSGLCPPVRPRPAYLCAIPRALSPLASSQILDSAVRGERENALSISGRH